MTQSQSLLMPTGVNMGKALQRYRRVSAIQSDMGAAVAQRHIDVTVQVRQGMAFKVKLVVTGNEVLDDVSANLVVSKHRGQMTRRAMDYGRATSVRIAAGTAVCNHCMRVANEIGVVCAANHRCAVARRLNAEVRARSCQRVMARPQINGVMAEAALTVVAETLTAYLTTAVFAEPKADTTEISAACVSVAGACR